jgi:hypothetical protein
MLALQGWRGWDTWVVCCRRVVGGTRKIKCITVKSINHAPEYHMVMFLRCTFLVEAQACKPCITLGVAGKSQGVHFKGPGLGALRCELLEQSPYRFVL